MTPRGGPEFPACLAASQQRHPKLAARGIYSRPEAPGVDRPIAGISMRHKEDEARLRDGGEVFESLYAYFKRKPRLC